MGRTLILLYALIITKTRSSAVAEKPRDTPLLLRYVVTHTRSRKLANVTLRINLSLCILSWP